MLKRLKKHFPHIVMGHGILLFLLFVGGILTFTFQGPISALLAAATSSLNSSKAIVYFTPYGASELLAGETADIDLNINAKASINAMGATITYPREELEIVGISKKRSFMDLWTEDTVIKEDTGEIHFSGGTTQIGGLMGTGTVLTLSVRAKKDAPDGKATLAIADLQVLANDGKGTALNTTVRPFAYTLVAASPLPPIAASGSNSGAAAPTPPSPSGPNADLDGNGRINLVDISILSVRMLLPYDPRFDLNMDGKTNLADLSILFAKM